MKNILIICVLLIIIFLFFSLMLHKENYRVFNNFITDQKVLISDGIGNLSTTVLIPSGTIVMWHQNEIPDGWVICDGDEHKVNGNTVIVPDLRDKFVKSVPATNNINSTGGSNTYILTDSNLPSHKHTTACSSEYTVGYDGVHSHGEVQGSGTNFKSKYKFDTAGEHTHGYYKEDQMKIDCDSSNRIGTRGYFDTVTDGIYNYDPNQTYYKDMYGRHDVSISKPSTRNHSHTGTATCSTQYSSIGYTGNSNSINHEPQYYKLIYIYKL
jgi:microcystin-dependent protein